MSTIHWTVRCKAISEVLNTYLDIFSSKFTNKINVIFFINFLLSKYNINKLCNHYVNQSKVYIGYCFTISYYSNLRL